MSLTEFKYKYLILFLALTIEDLFAIGSYKVPVWKFKPNTTWFSWLELPNKTTNVLFELL